MINKLKKLMSPTSASNQLDLLSCMSTIKVEKSNLNYDLSPISACKRSQCVLTGSPAEYEP